MNIIYKCDVIGLMTQINYAFYNYAHYNIINYNIKFQSDILWTIFKELNLERIM